VTDNAQVYGVMWDISDKKLSGTAQLRGDLENNFTKEISKGVFYGMVDDGMLNNANFGANLTTPPTEVTASIDNAKWYSIPEDSVGSMTIQPKIVRPGNLMMLAKSGVLQVFDINGNMLGTVKYDGNIHESMRRAGFKKGAFLVRNKDSRSIIRVNQR